jgi:hypothetical protein
MSPKGLMLMLGKLDAVNAMGNGSFYAANGKLAIDVGQSGRWVLLCNHVNFNSRYIHNPIL